MKSRILYVIAYLFVFALLSSTSLWAIDAAAPDKITTFSSSTARQVNLTWTATGDDGGTGDVTGGQFQINYSSNPSATPDTAEYDVIFSSSWTVGSSHSKQIDDLIPETSYYFWIRSADEIPKWSVWSDTVTAYAPGFASIEAGIVGLERSSVSWGDYDNDGDLDLALCGSDGSNPKTYIYANNGDGTFTDINAGLPGVNYAALSWGDYDNDGDLDLAIMGDAGGASNISKIYRNDSGTFNFVADLTGAYGSSMSWGDYDNDGDLDIAISGYTASSEYITKIYRNNGNHTFSDIGASLTGIYYGNTIWGDYDNDGDLDLAVAGLTASGRINVIYRNDNGTFNSAQALTGLSESSLVWGDYDNDGDLDLAAAGDTGSGYVTRIYRNDSGTFSDISAGLTGVYYASLAWGDYDNDGDLDLVVTGDSGSENHITKIYRNDSGSFTDINAGLTGVDYGSLSWGDYDNDGDLDLVVAGDTVSEDIAKIYESFYSLTVANNAPSVPGVGLNAQLNLDTSRIEFRWDLSSDDFTPSKGLYYDIRVATKPITDALTNWIISPSTGSGVGSCSAQNLGNYPHGFVVASSTQPGMNLAGYSMNTTYYWQVRAIDTSLVKSEWSSMQLIYIKSAPDKITSFSGEANLNITLDWTAKDDVSDGAFMINYSTSPSATAETSEYTLNISSSWVEGSLHSKTINEVLSSTSYYFWIKSRSNGSDWSVWSDSITVFVNSGFTDISAGIDGVYYSSLRWGDYDNDGDLDLAVSGDTGSGYITKIYRNDSGTFTDISAGIDGVYGSSLSWGDYDNDGDLDLAVSGDTGSGYVTKIYRNDSGTFTDISAGLTGVYEGSLSWGDYDNDGDLDLAVSGNDDNEYMTKIYRNDSGTFTDISAGLKGLYDCSISWGDYDNDGDLDLAVLGEDYDSNDMAMIYRNDSGSFTDISASLPEIYGGSIIFGDYDNDGDLDLAISGYMSGEGRITKIYESSYSGFTNNAPSIPNSGFGAGFSTTTFILGLKWDPVSDNETPSKGVYYDIRVATEPTTDVLTNWIISPSVGAGVGSGSAQSLGNYPHGFVVTSATQPGMNLAVPLDNTTYYWQVRAIDPALKKSAWSSVQEAYVPDLADLPPAKITTFSAKKDYQILLGWTATGDNAVMGDVTGGAFQINYSTSSSVAAETAEYTLNISSSWTTGSTHTKLFEDIMINSTYYFWIRSQDSDSNWSVWSDSVSVVSGGFLRDWSASVSANNYLTSGVWGDYDNDGDLDIVVTTTDEGVKIYKNNGDSTFTNVWTSAEIDSSRDVVWGDYDNDGDLDLAITNNGSNRVYRNDGNDTFTNVWTSPESEDNRSISWGDYDNDGDLDLAVAVNNNKNRIYQNQGNDKFISIWTSAESELTSCIIWGDYDNDGDLDLFSMSNISKLRFYENTGSNNFTSAWDTAASFIRAGSSGDYDNDGDLDIFVCAGDQTTVYSNNGNKTFTSIWTSPSTGQSVRDITLGDYDNDGDLDFIIANDDGNPDYLYINNFDDTFTAQNIIDDTSITSYAGSFGDYDNDGDLDILFVNYGSGIEVLESLSADQGLINTAPSVPVFGASSYNAGTGYLNFRWNDSTDGQTAQKGLYYEVRAATESITESLNNWLVSTSSGIGTGTSSQQTFGNYPHSFVSSDTLQLGLNIIPITDNTTYYCQVRAMDTSLSKSAWATQAVVYVPYIAPGAVADLSAPIAPEENQVTLAWSVPGANGSSGIFQPGSQYLIQYSTWTDVVWSTAGAQVAVSTRGVALGDSVTHLISSLNADTSYYAKIWYVDENSLLSGLSNITTGYVGVNIAPGQITTLAGASDYQLKLTWNATGDDGSTGNVSNGTFQINYSTSLSATAGTGEGTINIPDSWTVGQAKSKILTGLIPDTSYYFWIRSADEGDNWSVWSDTAVAKAGSFLAGWVPDTADDADRIAFVDYNNDGNLDIALGESASKIYLNNGDTTFSNTSLNGSGKFTSFGDYDNDGDLDILSNINPAFNVSLEIKL